MTLRERHRSHAHFTADVRQHPALLKTGDKIATLIFWLIAGCAGLFIGVMLIYLSFDEMRFGRSNHPIWPLVGIGAVFLGLTFAGIWQCIRTITSTKRRNDAV
jgi:hypothetical protein